LRTKQVVLMPHATQVLLLPSLVCFAIVEYKSAFKTSQASQALALGLAC